MSIATLDSDQPLGMWDKPVSPEIVRELSILRPWRSFAAICFEWLVIAAIVYGSWRLWDVSLVAGIVGYLASVILIGSRQHALATLMHEGAHFRLAPNRTINEWMSQLLVSWPLLIDVRNYRKLHFAHHRSPNTDDDPDWELRDSGDWSFPKTRTGLFMLFLGDALGLRLFDQFEFFGRYGMRRDRARDGWDIARVTQLIILLSIVTWFRLWPLFLGYWIVPMLTWLKVVLRMRTIAEHYALEYDHMFRQTRTTFPRFWERIVFAPEHINFHLEHHLYPSVPFYNLPKLHRELMQSADYRDNAHLTNSYMGVLAECRACEALTHAEIQDKQKG